MSVCKFAPGSRWRMRLGNLFPHYDGAIFVIDRKDDALIESPRVHGHWIIPGRENAALWRYGVSRQRLAARATRLGEGEAEVPAEVPALPAAFSSQIWTSFTIAADFLPSIAGPQPAGRGSDDDL